MKLLVVANISDRSEWSLYTHLLQIGVQIDLICDPSEIKIDSFRKLGGNVFPLKIKHRFDLRAVKFIKKLLALHNYDTIYSPFNKGLATSSLATFGRKIRLTTYRGTLGNISYTNPTDFLTYLNPRLSAIACNCNEVKNSVSRYRLVRADLSAILKGHNTDWYQYTEKFNREALGIPEDAYIIGCIANMRPLKGISVLLDAFARFPEESSAHLVLIGEARDKKILSAVEKHKYKSKIHLLGFRKNAAHIASTFDVAVMPSLRREGLPRSIIETMSQKIPAVVTNIGGMPELVDYGNAGVIVPPNKKEELFKAIYSLYEDSGKRLDIGKKAQEHLKKNFALETYYQKMLNLLRG